MSSPEAFIWNQAPVVRKEAMNMVKKITDELAIADQPTLAQLQQLAEEGYRSVVNLRSSTEVGFLNDEQQHIEDLGLCYAHSPIQIKSLSLDDVLSTIQHFTGFPKPILIHCDNGIRSSIVVLIQIAVEQGIKAEDAFQKVITLGLL
ncbi:MAG: sulfur transferase domain-containing protein [Leptolyngbyaceae cyanobacterium bins.302]|nr:sulfur transferase domain-containing protein [Leptolyngbyaceae cyanobacterium bins.302]